MELKTYQKNVLTNLTDYIRYYIMNNYSPAIGYKEYWRSKGIETGQPGLPNYNDNIKGVPNVTIKVPTGGGKTFIATATIKKIFNFSLSKCPVNAVVWLVPSDAILSQTISALQNPEHPYRQFLDREFNHRINVYSKEDALNGINLNVSTVKENLSIFVFSYSSFKNTKDGRKSRKENSSFVEFKNMYSGSGYILQNAEEYSLLQTINYLNPLVIIDESHNAGTSLSVEMIKDFNPSFVLDLTATPKEDSNVVAMVDAKALKKAEMIKLPLLVYNRYDKEEVLATAVDLQKKLELTAQYNEKATGRYIRPIALFQAQNNQEGNITYSDIKKQLLDIGIPEEQIKIKTADIDELSGLNLMSKECPVRFIITVNALKEGWDCPFAYILASIANRSSKIDVEQIIGRVLRLPYTTLNSEYPLLNSSYVITSSSNFYDTAASISDGLKKSGYSDNDYRIVTPKEVIDEPKVSSDGQVTDLGGLFGNDVATWQPEVVQGENGETEENSGIVTIAPINLDNMSNEDISKLNQVYTHGSTADDIVATAEATTKSFEEKVANTPNDDISEGEKSLMKTVKLKPGFAEIARGIKLPQFYKKSNGLDIFSNSTDKLLKKDMLDNGYDLDSTTLPKNIYEVNNNMIAFDIDEEGSTGELARKSLNDSEWAKFLAMYSDDQKKTMVIQRVVGVLDKKFDSVSAPELGDYLKRLFKNATVDELDQVISNTFDITEKIKKHIASDIQRYRIDKFKELLDKQQIVLKETFEFLPEINAMETSSKIAKSLYEKEPNINPAEEKAITNIAALDNVVFWHHIKEKYPKEFMINGYINHYPDFVIYTKKCNIVLVEFKGEDRRNDDSKLKVALGKKWSDLAGANYSYFMVFLDQALEQDGAYNLSDAMDIIKSL